MDRLIPLSALEHQTYGVLAVDAHGGVRFCNRTAACLLHLGPHDARPLVCWRLARLRTPDGDPFCAFDCPVQREARCGALAPMHRVTRASEAGAMGEIELVTFPVPPPREGRFPLLHLLRPILRKERALDTAHHVDDPATATPPFPVVDINPLSSRENDVLRLLAAGLRDRAIADRLFISPVTVRNHVQRIMEKLGVHRRLEAVIAFLQRPH